MADGHLGKCKNCTKKDVGIRTVKRICVECGCNFMSWPTEIKRGGGLTCSRKCYYSRLRKIAKRGEESPAWKGDSIKLGGLHVWVERVLGKPKKCSHCGTTNAKRYDWANISRKYHRDVNDWMRLCRKCHIKYDGSKNRKNYPRLTFEQFVASIPF